MKLTHTTLLLKRTGYAYLVFFVCRILFLAFHFDTFSQAGFRSVVSAFFFGLIFDSSAIAYSYALFILLHILPFGFRNKLYYQRMLKWLFITITAACVLLNFIDLGYFSFSGKRTGIELFNLSDDINDQWVQYMIDYWHLVLILIIFLLGIWRFYPAYTSSDTTFSLKQLGTELLLIPIVTGLCFLAARGGWGLKPINTFDAARFVKPELVSLTINTPFQMITSVQQIGVERKQYMSDEEALKLFNPVKQFDTPAPFNNKNVVLIIVESLGKEYVGYYNDGKGYTPFLDSLMQHSTVFNHAYANGKRSITGLPAIMASMPSWMEDAYTSSFYQSNRLQSIGGILKKRGYDASFYHGARNGSMSFDNFIGITDGGDYSGLNEYPDKKDFDGNWGIYDGPYLQYFAHELNQKTQPFFSSVFTLSSHHPYNLPSGLENKYPEGTLPIHKTIAYTDDCIRQFFATASAMPWFKNTLFVVVADHSSDNETRPYQTLEGIFRIPLFFFDASENEHHEINKTVQQIDIMPGILWKLRENNPFFSFGNNPFDSSEQGYAIQYFNSVFQYNRYPYTLFFSQDKSMELYDMRTYLTHTENLIKKDSDWARESAQQLKAVIQVYNNSLINNKTFVESRESE